jgi:hypothetical protein
MKPGLIFRRLTSIVGTWHLYLVFATTEATPFLTIDMTGTISHDNIRALDLFASSCAICHGRVPSGA